MQNDQEVLELMKELKEYVKVVGSHNKHINSVADRLETLLKNK